jgi:hypothetical protein
MNAARSRRTKRNLLLAVLSAVMALAVVSPAVAGAATWHVTKTADTTSGHICAGPSASGCGLREAVLGADESPGPDRIEVAAGTYAITNGGIGVDDEVTIAKVGSGTVTIDGGGTQQLFVVLASAAMTFRLEDLTLADGFVSAQNLSGAAVESFGADVELDEVVAHDCRSAPPPGGSGSTGGAISLVGGSLTVDGGSFYNNSVRTAAPILSASGGAIGMESGGTVSISGASFANNSVENAFISAYASGGAVYADGDLTIDHSDFSGNTATETFQGGFAYGGAIAAGPVVQFTPSPVEHTVTVADSRFTNNEVKGESAYGAGLAGWLNTTTVTRSTFDANVVEGTKQAVGGGLSNVGAVLNVALSTLVGNVARNLTDPTSTNAGGSALAATGVTMIRSTTITANQVVTSGGDPTLHTAVEAGSEGGGLTVTQSIIAGNLPVGNGDCFTVGTYVDGGYNVFGTGSACAAGPTSVTTTSANLGPLANNGGLEPTVAPAFDSPAFNIGPASVCADSTDERGFPRPQAGACDAGAVEREAPPVPNTTITAAPPSLTATGTASFSFESGIDIGGSTFACSLDAAQYAACTSPRAYTGLADGPHTFAVRASNFLGVADPSPATVAWTVDTTAPGAPQLTTVPPARTHESSATVAFSGETGATFECRLDGSIWSACGSPETLTGLAPGPHAAEVRQTDGLARTSPAAATGWTVLAAVPPPVFVSVPATVTSSSTVAFMGSGGTALQCSVDGGAYGDCTSPFTPTLADGAHTIAVRQRDDDDGASAPIETTFALDTTAPPAPTIVSAPPPRTPASSVDVTFAGEPGGSFDCALDGGAWSPCAGTFHADGLALGDHRVAVEQSDTAGNTGPAAEVSFTVVAAGTGPDPGGSAGSGRRGSSTVTTRGSGASRCTVPKLVGGKLAAAKKKMKAAGCKIGKVKKEKGVEVKSTKVVHQSVKPGTSLPAGASVRLTLGTS